MPQPKIFVWSDEKIFYWGTINYENDRIYSTLPETISVGVRTHLKR